jgi:hypothetical protein
MTAVPNYYQEKERFFSNNIFKPQVTTSTVKTKTGETKRIPLKPDGTKMDLPSFVDDAH